ncbi:MAG TPA: TonB-dependent receptor [Pyrinomonadaceae bacterium]|nr:TonB-dependent receptor [Pyrinomonadaceae bacterium]
MKKQIRLASKFSLTIAVILLFAANVLTQTFNATIVGKVTDGNGSIVAGAEVVITQTGTNRVQNTTTNDDGEYIVPQLPPGEYTIKITAANFKTAQSENVTLTTDTTSRVDITLEAGNISETITVNAEPAVVNTETTEKGEVIVQRQVQELPLNGRDFTDLAKLVPGIYQRPTDDDQGQGLAAAGTRTDSTNFILDGVTNRSDRQGSVGVNTSVDSIQEFKVSTSTYSAEYGRLAGAQISVVSKSGTNRFSGTVFEFLRNDYFDATNTFAAPDEDKTLRRHQFGGTLGGPLPFLNFGEGGPFFNSGKDRTFFFASFERTQEIRSQSGQTTAPNAAWRTGDFRNVRGAGADGIFGNADDTNRVLCISRNPTTGAATKVECPTPNVIPFAVNPAFPNIVPANPISLQILSRLPAANVPGSLVDYRNSLIGNLKRNLFSTKIDHKFTNSNNMYFRFALDNRNSYTPTPPGRASYEGFGRDVAYRQYSYAIGDTHTFSANLINEFRVGYLTQNNKTVNENSDTDYIGLFGIPGLPTGQTPELQGFPAIRIDGFPDTGDSANTPFNFKFKNIQIYDSVTAIFGNHNLKVGVDVVRPNYIENDIRNVRGDFRFRGRNTNPTNTATTGFYSFADFLYGLPDSTQRQLGAEPADLQAWQYGFFAQDNWRVKPWLTLNLGLRYDYTPFLSERSNRLSNFIPGLGISACAGGAISDATGLVCTDAASLGLPGSLVQPDKNNIAPRIGFALQPFNDGKTVLRGGVGIFYSTESINPARQQLANNYPYLFRQQFARVSTNILLLSFNNPFPGTGTLQGLTTPQGIPTDSQTPEVYQYNLTFEREIVKDLAFEIGYVGSQGRHLGMRYNLNPALPTGAVTSQVLRLPNGTNYTLYTPVTRRPFAATNPTLGDITYQIQGVNSNYNALQASIRRRSKNGLTLLASYTFGKAMDQNSNTNNSTTGSQRNPQDTQDFRNEWALADYHRTHQFSASFNYDLPFGRGNRFFGRAKGVTQVLFGGWQINGIATILSGRPFTPVFSTVDTANGRPDLVSDPYENVPEGLLFNPYAFRRPVTTPGDPNLYGSAGRNILIGPSFKNFDISLFKNIRVTENSKLQLRWEVFNVFNHPNYQVPGFILPQNINETITVGPTVGGVVTGIVTPAITLNELINTTDVGRPRLTSNEAREMQFAIKFIF